MNKKGFTLIELVVSIALLSIVLVFLFNLLIALKGEEGVTSLETKLSINQAIISKTINMDIIRNGHIKFINCQEYDCHIIFNNETVKEIVISSDHKTFNYGLIGDYEFSRTLPNDLYYNSIELINNLNGLYIAKIGVNSYPNYDIEFISYDRLHREPDLLINSWTIDGISSTVFPSSLTNYDATVTCTNGVVGSWNKANWSLELSNLSSNQTICSIDFTS